MLSNILAYQQAPVGSLLTGYNNPSLNIGEKEIQSH